MNKSILLAATLGMSGIITLTADPVESALDSGFEKLEASVPGKFNIDARLRYEAFDLEGAGTLADGGPKDRDGTSIRVRYGYTTPDFNGFTAMVEGETLSRVGGDPDDIHFLDNLGDGTDLNQLWLAYSNPDYGRTKLGRQVYALDDHRFIGHVGWRQNIQSFDAFTAAFTGIDKLTVNGFYLGEQNAVNGTHNEIDAFGLNIAYAFDPAFTLTGFGYSIEGDDVGNAGISNETLGLRATGKKAFESFTLNYMLSYAYQDDNSRTPASFEADYYAGDLSVVISEVTLGGGFEILEPGFRTPLATVHKFNGFADVFLPITGFADGLEDYYLYAGYKIPVGNGIDFKVIYHWFDPEDGGGEYGEELDLVASYSINKYFSVMAKYGDYQSDGGSGGVGGFDKKMFTLDLNFKY